MKTPSSLLSHRHEDDLQLYEDYDDNFVLIRDVDEYDGNNTAETATETATRLFLEVSFHILYHKTWILPVLYLQAHHLDSGEQCSCTAVLKALSLRDTDSSWEFLSEDEYPVTGMPWCFLHPCMNDARLDLLSRGSDSDSVSYDRWNTLPNAKDWLLVSWMSMIIPAVKGKTPIYLFQFLRDNISTV